MAYHRRRQMRLTKDQARIVVRILKPAVTDVEFDAAWAKLTIDKNNRRMQCQINR